MVLCRTMNKKIIYRNIILINFVVPVTVMIAVTLALFYGIAGWYDYFGIENIFKNRVTFWIFCWFLWFHYTKFYFNHTYAKLTHFDPPFSIPSQRWNMIRVAYCLSFIIIFYNIFRLENEYLLSILLALMMFGFFLFLHFLPKFFEKKGWQ